eukprot:SAG31_NODE_15077_length_772_cov_0.867756_2_plen_166_part_01
MFHTSEERLSAANKDKSTLQGQLNTETDKIQELAAQCAAQQEELVELQANVLARLGLELAGRVEIEQQLSVAHEYNSQCDAMLADLRAQLEQAERGRAAANKWAAVQAAQTAEQHAATIATLTAHNAGQLAKLEADIVAGRAREEHARVKAIREVEADAEAHKTVV